MEYNKKDFNILKCSQPDGFGYIDDDRALELMELGFIEEKPKSEWYKSGYKATEKGIEQYNTWMKKIRELHGHIWEKDENGKLNEFAYAEGFHNGYVCETCGFTFCMHCYDEKELPVCDEKNRNKIMSDDNNLDGSMVALDRAVRCVKK